MTTDGGRLRYDRLLVTTGAKPVEAVPGAPVCTTPRMVAEWLDVDGVASVRRWR